ncbi:hypothetical protein GGI11_000480 [Coemansia sp. RSA 2049]|nr:hypothetical protein GGI11_000480 [Coemansia sp. RSA 2049]
MAADWEGTNVDKIYCPTKICSNERDWLAHKPASAALWTLGSITMAAGIFYLHGLRPTRYSIYNKSIIRVNLVFLTVAMYTRAALTTDSGDKQATYIASMVFNYFAAQGVYDGIIANCVLLATRFQPPAPALQKCWSAVATLHGWCEFALIVAGCTLMFHPHSTDQNGSQRHGIRCIQAFLGIVMCATFIVIVVFAGSFRSVRAEMSRCSIGSSVIVLAMVQLWSAFMFARTFVPLSSVARSSEALAIVLNYLPLIIASLSYLVLGEPLSGRVDHNEDEEAGFADIEARIAALSNTKPKSDEADANANAK